MRKVSKSEPPTAPTVVALTGFMGAGKSTVGRVLGALAHWRFIDLDCEIEVRAKRRIHEIFAMQGESRFREIEAETLRSALKHVSAPTVIALGGGTFVQTQNADLLLANGVHVVFLELEVEELLERCRCTREHSPQNPRPLADNAGAFCELYAQRLPSYRKAQLTVNTKGKTAEQVAREIMTKLRPAVPGRRR